MTLSDHRLYHRLDRNASWEVPSEVLNQSLMDAQPTYGEQSDTMWSAVQRQSLGNRMDVDEAPATAPSATTAVQSATLANSSASADPLASRYNTNSKDAYRERKRQKEIEQARIDKQKKLEEAARLRKEVEAERIRRGGTAAPASEAVQDAPETAETAQSAAVKAALAADRQKKLQDIAERQRVLKEIEEDRIRKFGADAKPTTTTAEQKAAFDEKQKEKAKEEWKVAHEQDQKRLAELRKQLAEEKERRAAEREAEAQARRAAAPTPSAPVRAAPAPTPASAAPVDPSAPKRSVAEEMAEARRARLGITKVTGTQAHTGHGHFVVPEGGAVQPSDEQEMTPEQIRARNKARALKAAAAAAAASAAESAAATESTDPEAAEPPTESPSPPASSSAMDVTTAVRDIHQRRHEEQRKKEQAEAERKARADRAARMLANTTSLATSKASPTTSSPQPSTSDPNAVFFQPSAPAPTTNILGDIPLETSSSDINEELALISLRLPDGRIKKAGFKARDPIVAVHRYAASWLPRDTIFHLFVPMPRQEFSDEQMETTTLRDAGLAPRGTLTVMTLQSRGTIRQGPPRPDNLGQIMGMMRFQGSEMEAAEEYANLSYEELTELQDRLGYVPNGMTDREIKSIPTEQYVATDDGDFCVICQLDINEGETIATLPNCSHKFHKDCVRQWLKDHRSCPACRQRVFDSTRARGSNQEGEDNDHEMDLDGDGSSDGE